METTLIEGRLETPFAESTVDRQGLRIQNVALLGRESRNGRTYSDRAMDDAARLYEGARIYLDHPRRSEERETRSVRDLVGKVVSARVTGDRVRGDVHLLDSQEGRRVLALAEQFPDLVGMSHRAKGRVARTNGQEIVEELTAVESVDLVTEPASTGGLRESVDHGRRYDRERDLEEAATRLFGHQRRPVTGIDLDEARRRLLIGGGKSLRDVDMNEIRRRLFVGGR